MREGSLGNVTPVGSFVGFDGEMVGLLAGLSLGLVVGDCVGFVGLSVGDLVGS